MPIRVSLSSAHIDNQAVSFSLIKRHYFDAFFAFAHRALTAATILARPSADILRFFLIPVSVLSFGLPGPRFIVAPARTFLACSRRAISISSSAIICLILMAEVYQAYLEPVTSDVARHLFEKATFGHVSSVPLSVSDSVIYYSSRETYRSRRLENVSTIGHPVVGIQNADMISNAPTSHQLLQSFRWMEGVPIRSL